MYGVLMSRYNVTKVESPLPADAAEQLDHPLLRKAAKLFRKCVVDRDGFLYPADAQASYIDVRVSARSLARALSFVDALAAKASERGSDLVLDGQTFFVVSG